MNITNIISAIGNNSSVYPLIVRDCGIEVPTKIVMTYNQNKKESKDIAYLAARERFLDEYSTSAVWLGGIPIIGKLCDFIIKKNDLNPKVNPKLFKEEKYQGINYNIENFKKTAPEAVKDLLKVKENKNLYEKFLAGKFIASTSIPILFMGFILPKLVFASSAKKIEEMRKTEGRMNEGLEGVSENKRFGGQEGKPVSCHCEEGDSPTWQSIDNDSEKAGLFRFAHNDNIILSSSNNEKLKVESGKFSSSPIGRGVSEADGEGIAESKKIGGLEDKLFNNSLSSCPLDLQSSEINLSPFKPFNLSITNKTSFTSNWVSKAANFSVQDKMAVTDGGYAVGRVTTARNKNESCDLAFKMAGMMFLNFVAPKWIEKGLNKLTGVVLDPIMLADKTFIEQIKNNDLKLPKSSSAKDLFEFIDNIANKDSAFVRYADKFGKIKMLKNGVRDPREYVDVKKLGEFRDDIVKFAQKLKSSNNVIKFVRNAKISKTANILTNVGLSSFLLAYVLPKCQFAFRKLITGSDLEPGLAPAEKELS